MSRNQLFRTCRLMAFLVLSAYNNLSAAQTTAASKTRKRRPNFSGLLKVLLVAIGLTSSLQHATAQTTTCQDVTSNFTLSGLVTNINTNLVPCINNNFAALNSGNASQSSLNAVTNVLNTSIDANRKLSAGGIAGVAALAAIPDADVGKTGLSVWVSDTTMDKQQLDLAAA